MKLLLYKNDEYELETPQLKKGKTEKAEEKGRNKIIIGLTTQFHGENQNILLLIWGTSAVFSTKKNYAFYCVPMLIRVSLKNFLALFSKTEI